MSFPSSELGPSAPLSRKLVCPPTRNQRDSPAGEGGGGSQFRRLEKSLALCLLCGCDIRRACTLHNVHISYLDYIFRICRQKKWAFSGIVKWKVIYFKWVNQLWCLPVLADQRFFFFLRGGSKSKEEIQLWDGIHEIRCRCRCCCAQLL